MAAGQCHLDGAGGDAPRGGRAAGDTRLFHWSGANAQSKRLTGGTELLALLLELEKQGRAYHLVGHSHGGSVIWEALVSAQIITEGAEAAPFIKTEATLFDMKPRRPAPEEMQFRAGMRLAGLRSVTTVGTPFLHFLPQATRSVVGWRDPRYTLSPPNWIRGVRNRLGAAVERIYRISTVGFLLSVPASILSLYFLHHYEVFVRSVALTGPALLVVLLFVTGPFNRLDFAGGLTRRARASRQVFERFADCWLGLWAPDDEAIALLKGLAVPRAPSYTWIWQRPQEREPWKPTSEEVPAQRIPVRIGNPISGTDMIPVSSFWKPTHVFKRPLSNIFNRWVGPRLSGWISQTLLHAVQGNDLPQTSLVYATPWPLPLDRPPPGLPEALAARLTEHANSQASQLAPEIRQILAQATLDGVSLPQVATERRPRTDGALVHTSYFDDPELLRLIALHIERHLAVPPFTSLGEFADDPARERALQDWLDKNAEAVRRRLAEFQGKVRAY